MNLTYAVPDLHGADDLLDRALAAIERHAAAAPSGSRAIVFLGDYVDRGPGSRPIVARLMAGPAEGWRWVCLKGNHEDMMVRALTGIDEADQWLDNGGDATLRSYQAAEVDDERWDVGLLPADLVPWAQTLPHLATDRHRVFVHASVDPALPLDRQVEHDMMWSRRSNRLGHQGRFVVHGHTPHRDGPLADGASIDLDTLAWHTGRLVVGIFDDARAGGPVGLIEVRRQAQPV